MNRSLHRLAAPFVLFGALLFGPVSAVAAETDATKGTETPSAAERAPASRRNAVLLSLGATLVPVAIGTALGSEPPDEATERFGNALAVTGLVIGPSVGHFYAGCGGRGVTGVAIRGGTLLVAVAVLDAVADNPETEEEFFVELFGILGVASVAALVVTASAVYDIASAGKCRRNAPDRTTAATGARLQLAPVAGARGAGLALRVTF